MKNKKLPIIIGIVLGLLIIASLILFIILKQNKITITFINDNMVNSTIKVRKGEKITLPVTRMDGYTFEGWYYNGTKVNDGVSFKEDTILIANWLKMDAKTMTITFDTDGGNKIEPSTIECDSELKLPTPTKDGYKFVNWLDKNEVVISNETKLVCEDVTLKAKWEKIEEKKEEQKPTEKATEPSKPTEVKKEYICPSGYTLEGTKCKMSKDPTYVCPTGTKADGDLCIKTSDSNGGTRVCKEDTVQYNGKGGLWTGRGDYHFANNSYGKCAYYKWDNYKSKSDCEAAYDQWHKTVWVSDLNGCYAEDKMGNYETVCDSNYQFYSSSDLSSKFGIHDNGKCLRKMAKEAKCDSDYVLTSGKCVKTIDATVK